MPNAPEEQRESTPSPTIIRDTVLLGQATDGSSADAWLGRVEKYLQFTAGAVGLVAALGFPAVYVQFSQFHIPHIFVPYDRALRAGILPGVFLAAVSFYLRWAGQEFRIRRAVNEGEVPVVMVPFFLIAGVGLLGVIMIWFAGFMSIFVLLSYRISGVAAGLLGIRFGGRNQLYVAIALLLITLAIQSLFVPRFVRRRKPISGSQRTWATHPRFLHSFSRSLETSLSKLVDNPVRFAVIWTLGAIVTFPAMSIGFLYSIRRFWEVLNIGNANWFGHRFIAFLGVLMVLIMYMFGSVFIVTALLESSNKKTRRRALLVLAASVLCGYFGAVSLYSYAIYQRLPQEFGGGQPIPVVFWVDKPTMPEALSGRLPRATFVQEGEKIRCESIYLVYIDAQIAVLSDAQAPPAITVILPRASIGAIVAAK